jgi:hypothetical protein
MINSYIIGNNEINKSYYSFLLYCIVIACYMCKIIVFVLQKIGTRYYLLILQDHSYSAEKLQVTNQLGINIEKLAQKSGIKVSHIEDLMSGRIAPEDSRSSKNWCGSIGNNPKNRSTRCFTPYKE